MGRDEPGGRKKYEAPRVTRSFVDRLSPKTQEKLTLLVSGTTGSAEPADKANEEFRIVLDFKGRFKQVSDGFCGIVGYGQSQLLGTRIDDITALRTANIPQHLGAVVQFGHFHCLWMFVHRDGHAILVRSDWELLSDLTMELHCGLIPVRG